MNDESLSWKRHMSGMSNNISRAPFMMKQAKYCLPRDSLKTLYYSLIESHLSYCLLAWGNAMNLSKIELQF